MSEGHDNPISSYMTVAQAAKFLGVSTSTLRNWDKQGKVVPSRHPVNGYRLYKKSQLTALLSSVRGANDHDSVDIQITKGGDSS